MSRPPLDARPRYTQTFQASAWSLDEDPLRGIVAARGCAWEIVSLSVQPTVTPPPPARIDFTLWRLYVSDERPANLLYSGTTEGFGQFTLDPNQKFRVGPYEELIIRAYPDNSYDTLTGQHGTIFGRVTLEELR